MSRVAFLGSVLGLLIALLLFGQIALPFRANSPSTQLSSPSSSSSSPSLSSSLTLLGGGARWAAGNGSSALYVDWKDNWLNHHSTDGASWGPWPLEADMDNWTASVSQALTENGFDVHLTGDLPDNLTGYDLLVLQAYWAIEPRHEPLIREFVANGGGVVILSGATEFLRCYCKDWWTYICPLDPASALVNEWLGSDSYVNTGGNAHVLVDNPFGTSLITGDALVASSGYSNAAVCSLHADSQVVATWDDGPVFAYTHEFGSGRVYYQAKYSDETPSAPPPPPPPPPPPENSTFVRIEPENVTVKKNDEFTVNVTIENVPADPGIVGIQFSVTWDPAILNATRLTEVVFHEVTPPAEYDNIWQLQNTVGQGFVEYAYTWLDFERARAAGYLPIFGNHTAATIEFEAVGEGTTTLHLSSLDAVDAVEARSAHAMALNFGSLANGVMFDSTVKVIKGVVADLNGDGKVDMLDAISLAKHFGCKMGDVDWDPRIDMNGDLEINILDAAIFGQFF